MDRLRRKEAADRFDEHHPGHADQREGAGVAGQDFDFPGTEGKARVAGVFACGSISKRRETDGQGVRAHVPAIGEHGHGIEPPAGDDFEHHGGKRDPEHAAGIALGAGVADGVVVTVGPARQVMGCGKIGHCWP